MEDLGRAALKQASKPRNPQKASNRTAMGRTVSQNAISVSEPVSGTGADFAANGAENSSTLIPRSTTRLLSDDSNTVVDIDPEVQFPNRIEPNLSFPPGVDAPDWLNFDAAFENFDAVLGSSGADLSMELLRPFNFEDFGAFGFPDQ